MLEWVTPKRVCKTALGLAFAAALASSAVARSDPGGSFVVPSPPGGVGSAITQPLGITGAGTTQLVPATTGAQTWLLVWAAQGASGTIQFVYGTGTNCGTGKTNLTDAMTMDGSLIGVSAPINIAVPIGAALCAVTTAAAPGYITYSKY